MSDHEYKPNSHKYREEQSDVPAERKKVEKVVKGAVKTRKKSEIRKLTDVFVAEDVNNVKEYLVGDLLIPAIKNTILDLIIEGATMIFKGEPRRGGDKRSRGDYVSYRNYADRDRGDERRYSDTRARIDFGLDDIYFESRADAERVLSQLDDIIDSYDRGVSVADLYDSIGKSCPHTYNKYGWTNLASAEAVRVRGGEYKLKMPRVRPLD